MKKILQNIVKWLYWKLNCHNTESFAKQLVLHALPTKMTRSQVTLIVSQINEQLQMEPVISCSFPGVDIEEFNELNTKPLI